MQLLDYWGAMLRQGEETLPAFGAISKWFQCEPFECVVPFMNERN